MKAVVWTKYGSPDGLRLKELEKPVPGDKEVLIKVHAATVTAGDIEIRSLKLPFLLRMPMRVYVGIRRPKRITILGQELAGEIESVGNHVKSFQPGDRVFGATGFELGAYAEYKCMPEESEDSVLVHKPSNISYEEAAAVPMGGMEALHFLGKGNIKSGEKVLIYGAGGSIGTIAVQLAKYYGAEVTALDSGEKLDMLRSIGADYIIDYTREDFSKAGVSYDVIFDVVGKSPFSRGRKSLKPRGRYILANPRPAHVIRGLWMSMVSGKKVIFGAASQEKEDLVFLKELIEAGKIKPVIDRTFPMEQSAEAHRYAESGRKKGNIVITIGGNNN